MPVTESVEEKKKRFVVVSGRIRRGREEENTDARSKNEERLEKENNHGKRQHNTPRNS